MQLVYLSYFAYLLILGGTLYFRREWQAYWSVMTYSMVGYMIGYFIAMFFPVESPWFAMAGWWHGPLSGGPVTATVNFIEHFGRVRGAAFPSEHVAGATAALWGAWKFRRTMFWILLPVFVFMCASTIWGRYHYMADVFGGTGHRNARILDRQVDHGTARRREDSAETRVVSDFVNVSTMPTSTCSFRRVQRSSWIVSGTRSIHIHNFESVATRLYIPRGQGYFSVYESYQLGVRE